MAPHLHSRLLTRNNFVMSNQDQTNRTKKTLRLPSDLQHEIESAAAQAGHSANEEIIRRLRAYTMTITLNDIAKQNAELKRMVQQLIDRQP